MDIRRLNGRVPAGTKKYNIRLFDHSWIEWRQRVIDRDGQCLKCGSKENLQADHFHPSCYKWRKQFVNWNKIQTLCKGCHSKMPSMKTRSKNLNKYIFLK